LRYLAGMGVKDLWTIASPCEERISLHQLRGQTLAIDLAGWIVQNQTVAGLNHRVTRPHLRNLIFRTQTLLGLDILPVFVLDGQAPKIKSATVASRNAQTWGPRGHQSSQPSGAQIQQSPKVQKRRQFSGVLKECGRLLESLGVPVVTAPGEAEAFCAALDRCGVVDGVVSDDSDSLCYGAKIVYRNFSTDPKNFSVSKYCAKRLRKEVGLSRERIVVMALLLGCDYTPGGVTGVGKENIIRLFQHWGSPEKGELQLVIDWSTVEEEGEVVDKKPTHCGTCGHPGSVGAHRKSGCTVCPEGGCEPGTPCPCLYHSQDNQKKITESSIRRKALETPGWPHHEVIKEFYALDGGRFSQAFKWKCPDPPAFIQICVSRMDWEQDYSIEKVQNLITRWQVQNPSGSSGVSPTMVVKTRIQAGQNMVEVEWSCNLPSLPNMFTACVPTTDFEKAYPTVLQEYIEMKESKKRKPKKAKAVKNKENQEPVSKPAAKAKKAEGKTKLPKGVQPSITKFLKPTEPILEQEPLDPMDDLVRGFNESLDLRPKNLLIKKTVYSTTTVVREARLIEAPKRAKDPELKSNVFDMEDSLDNGSVNLQYGSSTPYQQNQGPSSGNATKHLQDSDIKQYLEETYNSEMSGILDDILGCNGGYSPDSMKKPDLRRLDFNALDSGTKSYNTQKTSTPDLRKEISQASPLAYGSPCLKPNTELRREQPRLNDHRRQPTLDVERKTNPVVSEEDSFDGDEFDVEVSKCTPFLERVKKRLANK